MLFLSATNVQGRGSSWRDKYGQPRIGRRAVVLCAPRRRRRQQRPRHDPGLWLVVVDASARATNQRPTTNERPAARNQDGNEDPEEEEERGGGRSRGVQSGGRAPGASSIIAPRVAKLRKHGYTNTPIYVVHLYTYIHVINWAQLIRRQLVVLRTQAKH